MTSKQNLSDLENCFFLLHVSFKNVTLKSAVSPMNCNMEKKTTTLNTEGLKRGTKKIHMNIK